MLSLYTFVAIFSIVQCVEHNCFSHNENRCLLTPETGEGPYYVENNLVRKDVREGKPGLRLNLLFKIIDANTCKPLYKVGVDIWHCDEFGYYSGHLKMDPDMPPVPGGAHTEPTDNATFMRGIQYTNSKGFVEFVTNFPGWYYGRTTHIHVKIFKADHKFVYTGQLFFTEKLTAKVYKLEPYIEHEFPRTHNEEDQRYTKDFGNLTTLLPKQINKYDIEFGLKAEMTFAINPNKNEK